MQDREAAWEHASKVLSVPEFISLRFLTVNCGIVDRMVIQLERKQKETKKDSLIIRDHQEIIALTDFWVLGFFDILRIVVGKEYAKFSEFEFHNEFKALKRKTNMVRSGFAKLRIPGKGKNVIPSHSSIAGERGTSYAVYNNSGNEVTIFRRELADKFLEITQKEKPSTRFQKWIKQAKQ